MARSATRTSGVRTASSVDTRPGTATGVRIFTPPEASPGGMSARGEVRVEGGGGGGLNKQCFEEKSRKSGSLTLTHLSHSLLSLRKKLSFWGSSDRFLGFGGPDGLL